jgi:WD40 repeat protein
MRQIASFLTVLSLWLLAAVGSSPSQAIFAGTSTATQTAPVSYEKILQIPSITSEYGIIAVEWVAWNPVAEIFAVVYQNGHAIRILDGSTNSTLMEFDFPDSTGNSAFAWSPDGKYIAALLGSPNSRV